MTDTIRTAVARDCEHGRVITYNGVGPNLWACADCRVRFYPACPTCVDVGHRNIDHPAAPSPVTGEDHPLARLIRRIEKHVDFECGADHRYAFMEDVRLIAGDLVPPSPVTGEAELRAALIEALLPEFREPGPGSDMPWSARQKAEQAAERIEPRLRAALAASGDRPREEPDK